MTISKGDNVREFRTAQIEGREHILVGNHYYDVEYMKEQFGTDSYAVIHDEILSWQKEHLPKNNTRMHK